MPGIDFDVVRQRVSMAEVLRLLEFVPTRVRGDQMRGPCPVHGSTSGRSCSFSVNVQRSRYQCFRCGSHGNALEFWAAVRQLGVHAAAEELCQRLGIEIPWIERW